MLVSGLETVVTVVLARPLGSRVLSTVCSEVGGGVGGALPNARACSAGIVRLRGCGEDLWEWGGVAEVV